MLSTRLGAAGPNVSALGLGAMGMSDFYGPADETESIATIHAALEAGVTLIDTGDFYGMGHNEMLIGDALKGGRRDKAILSIKFGAQRGPDGAWLGYAADPNAVKTALSYTLKRLRVDYIDIYRPARVSPLVPIEDTIGAIADLVRQGYVRHIGLSEAGADSIRRAHKVHPIVDLQIEYAIITRGLEREILPTLRELGIGVTAYGVLSRGLISESALAGGSKGGFRAHSPRFQGENLDKNLALVRALKEIADSKGVSVAQLAIAWVRSRGPDIVPLIGARKRARLAEALGAMDVALSPGAHRRCGAAGGCGWGALP
ncbi:MAG: aldo/keto reductase [Hyphomonadaceae bacterium JAD_PAG50586_4]|nr:MAG: aldo/keto reductase [Hyphomonadaceae bacterium JAD_PAG50586_4]